MTDDGDQDDPDAQLAEYARALADAAEAALGPWVVRGVVERGGPAPEAEVAAAEATADVMPRLRALLAQDPDEQATTPLAILRTAVAHPTAVLAHAGVPPVDRDEFARRSFPDDAYDLTPARFEDIAPELKDPGLAWGAAKAFVHLRRRRAEGRR